MIAIRKGMYVRHLCDDGRGGSYVYGVAVTNGNKKPRVRWENGTEQMVPVHTLEIVTGDIPGDARRRLHALRPSDKV